MAEYSNETFSKDEHALDGNAYTACTFDGCTLIYRGFDGVTLKDCTFNGCKWTFDGPASNTMRFLAGLYGLPGGHELVEHTFASIRNGGRPPEDDASGGSTAGG